MYRINSITPRRFWLAVGVLLLIFAAAVFASPLPRASRLEPRTRNRSADDSGIIVATNSYGTLTSGLEDQPSRAWDVGSCLIAGRGRRNSSAGCGISARA